MAEKLISTTTIFQLFSGGDNENQTSLVTGKSVCVGCHAAGGMPACGNAD
jgi:hypothetical protein